MTTLRPHILKLNDRIREARKTLDRIIRKDSAFAQFASAVDGVAWPASSTVTDQCLWCYSWTKEYNISFTFYVTTRSIPDLIPTLEAFERIFNSEFSSFDNEEGVRRFTISSSEFGASLSIICTPDEDAGEGNCRKILVGEDVHTEVTRTPRYEIRCN